MKRKIIKAWRRDWQLYLFMLVPTLYLLIFNYVPMAGLQLAFRKYSPALGVWGSRWVGLDNIVKFIKSYQFERVVSNTLILSVQTMIWMHVIPITFALLVNALDHPRFQKVSQTIVNLPHFISTVVLVGILMQVFNNRIGLYGVIVHRLTGAFPKDMFGQLSAFRPLYTLSSVWQGFGWSSIIYVAALAGVDAQLHEAAQIDGASRVQRIWHIDLPSIKPTIVILLIMGVGKIMSVGFEKAYLMQNSLNLKHSELISTYVYRIGLSGSGTSDVAYATAIDLFNAIVNLVLILGANTISRKLSDTSLW